MNSATRHVIWILLLFVAGCAVSTDNSVVTQPAMTTGKMSQASGGQNALPTTVAILPFTNSTDSKFAYEVVRRTMANHFATRNYRWLHWRDVDNRLRLAGIDSADQLAAHSPRELAQILGVDGLIYGNVTNYAKTFVGIVSQITVGVDLKFIDADGKVIWQAQNVKKSRAGGVSTSPVGLIINALVAANHLRGDLNLYRVADDLGREMAAKLPEPARLSQREKPVITNVVHSGVGQVLKYGDTLDIALEGDPKMTAAAVIDGLGVVDLKEQSPGQYVGHVNIPRKLNLKDVVVTGRLQDGFGQTTSWISPYGLLDVDNTPPGAVSHVAVTSADGSVHLTWQPPGDSDLAGYTIGLASTETGAPAQTFNAPNSDYIVDHLTNFDTVYITVAARDIAGNLGPATRIAAAAAPDPRFAEARLMGPDLPAVISGVWKLAPNGSPYRLRSESRIATDGVLLIGAGVTLIASPEARLSVLGELHIFGNAQRPVVVAGDKDQTFNAFLVLQGKLPVTVTGLKVNGAGVPVEIDAGEPLIADSSLTNSFNAISIAGSARPVIKNCTISGAKASGVVIQGNAQPTFEGNHFINNQPFHVQNGSTYTVNLAHNTFEPAASNTTILGEANY
ncbi:MAG TPA: GNA1162 family protein [Pseudomonadales bacterium]|nr:GNA1162 family protein [Pseudomonadales bacterium]